MNYVFPFGEQVRVVKDVGRKRAPVFLLGVYASAVHAQWCNKDGKQLVRALAVASEPSIFWRGNDVAAIIGKIPVPAECGFLLPASDQYNGPSGRAIDEYYLRPLGIDREAAWLCDLLPESRQNASQERAIETRYNPLVKKGLLPETTVPQVPRSFADDHRRKEILDEFVESGAYRLVLLGDPVTRDFLSHFVAGLSSVRAVVNRTGGYGRPIELSMGNTKAEVFVLVHPRQAAGLGRSTLEWRRTHLNWVNQKLR